MPNRSRLLFRFSTGAMPISIGLWSVGMHLSSFVLGGAGLAPGIHPAWYAGVVLAVGGMLAAIAVRRHSGLLSAYAIAVVVMVVSTGMLLERGPRFPYIFQSYAYGHQILESGAIDYSQAYASWPGWHIFTAAAVGVSRIDPNVLLTWIPLWLALSTLAALMTLFRRYRLSRAQRWLAISLAAVAFISPTYPTPPAAGFIIVVFLVSIVLDDYVAGRVSIRSRAGILVLFAALVVTHLLTSLVGLLAVVGATVVATAIRHRIPGSAALYGLVLIPAYLFYVAVVTTADLLPGQLDLMLNFDRLIAEILGRTGEGIAAGSSDHTQVVLVRISYVVGLATLAVLGAMTAIARRADPRVWLLPSIWVISGIASLALGPYGGEILARGSALAAPGSIALASLMGRIRIGRAVLIGAIVLAAIATPLSQFGSELFDYVRPTELAADRVLAERHPSTWNLARRSRTWFYSAGKASTGPYVVVYGPLYETTSSFIGEADPPPMPFWSYDNGDVRIMVRSETP